MKNKYNMTIKAAYLGYVVQAIVNNFVPLLFIRLQSEFGIPLGKITLLITFNFGLQLLIDLFSTPFIEKIGYRASMILSNASVIVGFLLLTVLPGKVMEPFAGILLCVCIYAIGGGLQEVLVSPIVEACPTENKETQMSLLHSAYCWGHVAVVLLSTAFFAFAGISNWRTMAVLWCIVPAIDLVLFTRVPIARLESGTEETAGIKDLATQGLFWLMFLMMLSAGASEQAVSQWSSAFAEKGLGVTKTLGDFNCTMHCSVSDHCIRSKPHRCTSWLWTGRLFGRYILARHLQHCIGTCQGERYAPVRVISAGRRLRLFRRSYSCRSCRQHHK